MKSVIQRVLQASVSVDGEITGQIGLGLCIFLGVGPADTDLTAQKFAQKVAKLRIFCDESGKMNRSVQDCGGKILLISQFTLFGDCNSGNRPSFTQAGPPHLALQLYEKVAAELRALGVVVEMGRFAADMKVSLINDGPVTMLLDI